MEVGVRRLRAELSDWLRRVRRGEEIVVTDRGRPVARLVPIGDRAWDELVAEGAITPPARPKGRAPRPRIEASVTEVLLEMRRAGAP